MNTRTQILFELGRPNSNIHWPDYLQYGFDTSDVPALLTLTADETLHSADSDSHQIWVPLHAWRVLGQLRSEQAVEPLLNLFEPLFDDDWACDELPEVMAMIGAPAIEPLATYLNNREQSEWARVLAVDSMAEVALRDNALRDRVVQRFRHYMAHPDMETDELNGELISRLIDLDATEAIEEIRDLFNRECVDLTVVGDLEDVEMELGLREERTTPRQDLFFSSNPRLERPEDSDDPIAMLEYYLALYGDEDSIENVSELDGFLTAIACAPGLVPPHRWVPAVWGEQTPAWESPQDASKFNDMLHMCHEFTVEFFLKGDFDPLFLDISENSEHRQMVEDWCIGFLRGVELWGPLNPTSAAIAATCFKPILLFGTEEGFTELEGRDEEDIIALQNEIRPNILRLYEQVSSQARTQRKPQTVVSKTPKVGRNDPCPCGSGQKYKKCCLQ